MTCGCRSSVEKQISIEGIEAVVSLDPPIYFTRRLTSFSKAGSYSISIGLLQILSETSNEPPVKSCCSSNKPQEKTVIFTDNAPENTIVRCIARRKGLYDKPGDCPVCGMDLVKEAALPNSKMVYTCPMHPEVVQEGPGSFYMRNGFSANGTNRENENKVYNDLVRKMKIAVVWFRCS
jgi:Cu2+-exporting ATPase